MSPEARNPSDTIENLAIGKIIEVDGSHIVAELDRKLSELSRVYAVETYPIGQFGSILTIVLRGSVGGRSVAAFDSAEAFVFGIAGGTHAGVLRTEVRRIPTA